MSEGNREVRVLYHYTSTWHLSKILEDGYLKLTPSNLKKPIFCWVSEGTLKSDSDDYKPVVWLSDILNFDKYGNGLDGGCTDKTEVAIEVPSTDCVHWEEWAKENNMDSKWKKALIDGRNYQHWYISEKPIPIKDARIIYRSQIDGTEEQMKRSPYQV